MDAITRMIELHGRGLKNAEIAKKLNEEDYQTDNGKRFIANTVKLYLARPVPDQLEASTGSEIQAPVVEPPVTEPEPVGVSVAVPGKDLEQPSFTDGSVAAMNEVVQSYRSGKLREMMQWFDERQQRGEVMVLPENRPLLKGNKVNCGIMISEDVRKGALVHLERTGDVHRVGRNLSQLIEFLLWKYQGAPSSLVVGAEQKESQVQPAPKPTE